MSIFIVGMKCSLCNKSMEKKDELISFPAFVQNKRDPLYLFSDGTFHLDCFYEHPLSKIAYEMLEMYFIKTKPSEMICNICNKLITNPEHLFSLGYLTYEKTDQLFQYNYFHCHKDPCLQNWPEKQKVIGLFKDISKQNKWYEDDLNCIINYLTDTTNS